MGNYQEKIGKNSYKVYYKNSANMQELNDGSVNLIITSPPYFNLKDYSTLPNKQKSQLPSSPKKYHQTYSEYLDEMYSIWSECWRVLDDNGVMVVNIDVIKFKTDSKNIIPIPFHFIEQCSQIGFGCKDIMIYNKLTGIPFQFGKKLKNRHEYLLIFAKSNDYTWNLDDIRLPYAKDYIYPPGHKRRNPIGYAPSSVWGFHPPFQTGSNHYHYCPFPDGLVDRFIKLYSNPNDLVLDPFLGSGKVVARAKVLNRSGVGYEINNHFSNTIEEMIKNVK
tara:strand:+ start:3592 stop:4422 length:831 start_codon:yes stop_codon:yes gene_type:complete